MDDLLARATHVTSAPAVHALSGCDSRHLRGECGGSVVRPANREQNLADVHPQKPLDPPRLQLAALIPRR